MLPVWLVLAGLQLAQPHCESPGQARWGSRHGSDLPLRTCSVTRALSLSPLRALCFLHIARRLAAGGAMDREGTAISPRDENTVFLYLVTMYLLAVFSKTCCPASGPGRPHSASPLGRLPLARVCARSSSSYTCVHHFPLPGPIPFSKTTHAHARSLEPSSCPPHHPHANSLPHSTAHLSCLPLTPFIYPAPLQPHLPFGCLPTFV